MSNLITDDRERSMASSADLSAQAIEVLDDRSWSIATPADHSTTGIEVLVNEHETLLAH